MTPEQKERIRAAARELSAAMTEADADFYVDLDTISVIRLDSARHQYAHTITVTLKTEEVIA